MMTNLERLKLIKKYQDIYQNIPQLTGIAKIKMIKQAMDILKQLGYNTHLSHSDSLKNEAITAPTDLNKFFNALNAIEPRDFGDNLLRHKFIASDVNDVIQRDNFFKNIRKRGKRVLDNIFNAELSLEAQKQLPIIQTKINVFERKMQGFEKETWDKVEEILNQISQEIGFDEEEVTNKINTIKEKLNAIYNEEPSDEKYQKQEMLEQVLFQLDNEQQEKIKQRDSRYLALLPENPVYQELLAQHQEIQEAANRVGNEITEKLIKVNQVSDDEVNQWIKESVIISSSATNRLKKANYSKVQLLEDMAEFYRLTGGRMAKIEIATNGAKRAHIHIDSQKSGGKILIDNNFNKMTLWHEMGHTLEFDPVAKSLANDFLHRRRINSALYSLAELTGIKEYGNELAYKDHFLTPYIGKYYPNGITEVFSMGLEKLCNPVDVARFFAQDRDMAEIIVGYLAKERSELYQFIMQHEKANLIHDKNQKIQQQQADNLANFAFNSELNDDEFKWVKLSIEYNIRKNSKYKILGTIATHDKKYTAIHANAWKANTGRPRAIYVALKVDKYSSAHFFQQKTDLFNFLTELQNETV